MREILRVDKKRLVASLAVADAWTDGVDGPVIPLRFRKEHVLIDWVLLEVVFLRFCLFLALRLKG
jgi:hypothetical protein